MTSTEQIDSLTQDQLILARSKLWTRELDKLLRRWKMQIGKREEGHLDLARKYNQRHYIFGVPATVLTTLIATGVLATFRNCDTCAQQDVTCSGDQWIRLVIGIIGVFSAGLTAFQTLMNYQGEVEKHKSASDGYGQLFRILDTILLTSNPIRGDPVETLQNIRNQYDDIVRRSPTLPKAYDAELTYDVINQDKLGTHRPDQIVIGTRDLEDETSKESKKSIESEPSTVEDLDKVIAKENDYNTSDDEREVCISFDLDSAQRAQHSIQHALKFEMKRLANHSQASPEENC
uniref:SMODS and SLOG-associating 2TM effector domain-containing protein n=1 Tax=Marseillevirus LCMAC102 TaxID=2506603 RepID=A0A481YTI0_9VIRU|nr:MAG: uncharacterized protein LCMAC102_04190 [Marseillevirus LCMAC102]